MSQIGKKDRIEGHHQPGVVSTPRKIIRSNAPGYTPKPYTKPILLSRDFPPQERNQKWCWHLRTRRKLVSGGLQHSKKRTIRVEITSVASSHDPRNNPQRKLRVPKEQKKLKKSQFAEIPVILMCQVAQCAQVRTPAPASCEKYKDAKIK